MAQGLINNISSGPGFMEKGGLGKESHPPSRVDIGDRYEKKLDPFARSKSETTAIAHALIVSP